MHRPGKRGTGVSRVLEKQLARLGLHSLDVFGSTGYGGDENEGQQGIHTYVENLETWLGASHVRP